MDNTLDSGRWVLPHCSKLDILEEPSHTHLILHFLGDAETEMEKLKDGSFILYGSQEAILVVPSKMTTLFMLELVFLVKTFFNPHATTQSTQTH